MYRALRLGARASSARSLTVSWGQRQNRFDFVRLGDEDTGPGDYCGRERVSGAPRAPDGKPRRQGRVQARLRTSPALCPSPGQAVFRASNRSREQ